MPKVRVNNFAISLDGYAAGPDQSVENPLGVGGESPHEWAFATRSGRRVHGMEGGDTGAGPRGRRRHDHGSQHVLSDPRAMG